MFDMNKIFF